MLRLFRHLAYEGPRHTGATHQPRCQSHYAAHPRRHFVLSAAEWERLLDITRPGIVTDSFFTAAVGYIGGGYGADVFLDRCPWNCDTEGDAIIDGCHYRNGVRTSFYDPDALIQADVLRSRAQYRAAFFTQPHRPFIDLTANS